MTIKRRLHYLTLRLLKRVSLNYTMHFLKLFLNYLLEKYFFENRCLLVFSEETDILNLNFSLPIILIGLDENGKFDRGVAFNYFGCDGFLIYSEIEDVLSTFVEIEMAIRYNTMERFNQRRYIVIGRGDLQEDAGQYIEDIFALDEMNYVADFLLAIFKQDSNTEIDPFWNYTNKQFGEDIIELYTHKFVGTNDTREIIHLGSFNSDNFDSRLSTINLYPEKLKNGYGRPFRIATFTYKPYSVPNYHDGTELQIAIEFCNHYNLTPVYVVDEAGEWGEIYDNWTGYGILGNVMNDNGDVGLGALYTWAHEYAFLDLSKPVVRTGITCLTPAPHLAGGWLVPLFSFTYEMWLAVGITFIVCVIALTLVDSYAQKISSSPMKYTTLVLAQESTFDTASIFLLQAFNRFGHSTLSKNFLHGCMFIFSLLIASSYSSGLSSSMTVPRYVGAINTVQELVDSGIQWGATSIAWIMSILDAEEYNYKVLVERFVKTDGPRLKKYNNKRFAFSIERLPAGQFAIGDYITEKGAAALKLMHEDLYWEQCVLMTKKSSVWIPQLDQFILTLAQTGLNAVWEYRVATQHLNPKIQKAVQYASHHTDAGEEPVKLHWMHVQGAFGILIIGISLASICFVIELLRKRQIII